MAGSLSNTNWNGAKEKPRNFFVRDSLATSILPGVGCKVELKWRNSRNSFSIASSLNVIISSKNTIAICPSLQVAWGKAGSCFVRRSEKQL
jgi:hypothetical protein